VGKTVTAPADLAMSAPDIGDRERELVMAVLRDSRLSGGPMVERFEQSVAERAGRRHGVAVSSGTAGLHVAVKALGIGRGDRVATPSFSFAASVNSFLYEGAEPAFVDIDPDTYEIDPDALAATCADQRPAAILPVDVFGQPADLERIAEIAERSGLPIIEDACEALGAVHRGRPAGSLGAAAVFAFYPNKQITTGEGGVLVTDDDRIAALARSYRNQGRGEGDDWFDHVRLGYNYRLDELSAAVGVGQMERLDELLDAREDVARRYGAALASVDGVRGPVLSPATTRMSWFVYVVTLDPAIDRDSVVRSLAARGVPTRAYFRPIHLQPYIVERFGDRRGSLPVTEDIGRRTLALPFHGRLSQESVEFVTDALRASIAAAG
jgi:perosamine synthetase